jgi:hypothetical protein
MVIIMQGVMRNKTYIFSLFRQNSDGSASLMSSDNIPYTPDSDNGKRHIQHKIGLIKRLERENHKLSPENRGKYAVAVQVLGTSEKTWFDAHGNQADEASAFS